MDVNKQIEEDEIKSTEKESDKNSNKNDDANEEIEKEDDEGEEKRTCYICNKKGHISYNCKAYGGASYQYNQRPYNNNYEPISKRKCYNCRRSGHLSYNCPEDFWLGKDKTEPDKDKRVCFRCNRIGHLSYNCPNDFWKEDKKNKTEENPKNLRKLAQVFAWVAEQLGQ